MVTKRNRPKKLSQPAFDVDEFERRANAGFDGMADAEVKAWQDRIPWSTTARQAEEADGLARKFFEEMKSGRQLSRPARSRRGASTK
jgi:hypothetical protein